MIYQIIQCINLLNDYFGPIEITFNWGIFLGLLGVYLALFSLYKGKVKKSLVMEASDSFFHNVDLDREENIKLTTIYKGKKIDDYITTSIYLGNDGNVELKSNDFASPCSIRFNHEIELMEYIVKSSDEFTLIESKFENNMLMLDIKFIDPKTFLNIKILFRCNEIPEINAYINLVRRVRKVFNLKEYDFDGHWLSMSREGSGLPIMFMIFFIIPFISFAFLISKKLGLTIWDNNLNVILPLDGYF